MKSKPYWNEARLSLPYPPLVEDLNVEILIVGGGITGVTAAHLLSRNGHKVALVERYEIGSGDTGHTTAHLTFMTDTRLSELVRLVGAKQAKHSWDAGLFAMNHIREVSQLLKNDVGLVEIPSYLVAAMGSDINQEKTLLIQEARMAKEMGFDVHFQDQVDPTQHPGIRFEKQLKFHPIRYLQEIAAQAAMQGTHIFEDTEIDGFDTDRQKYATANGRRITFNYLIIATHMPIQGTRSSVAASLFQTKLSSYSTYAMAARIPKGTLDEMIWSDTGDPFNYLRVEKTPDADIAILGGEDHKTGQLQNTIGCFSRLETTLGQLVSEYEITHRWSGRVVETPDGLPYIGETKAGEFVATGFSGNGMTFGTLAALMARDFIEGVASPFTATFDPHRMKISTLRTYIKENSDFPYHLLKDRHNIPKNDHRELSRGEGRVIKINGKPIAVCKLSSGTEHRVSAVCSHLGCLVAWNEAEQTWDCPCHGSRFLADGRVVAGPAEHDLEPMD